MRYIDLLTTIPQLFKMHIISIIQSIQVRRDRESGAGGEEKEEGVKVKKKKKKEMMMIMMVFVCWLVPLRPSNLPVYLRDGSAQTNVSITTLRWKLRIKLSISPSHSILKAGRSVPALTLSRRAPGRVAIVANFKVTGMP